MVDRGYIIAVPIDGLYNFVLDRQHLVFLGESDVSYAPTPFPSVIQLMLDPTFDRHNVRNVSHMCQT